jgi:hypothetical protein
MAFYVVDLVVDVLGYPDVFNVVVPFAVPLELMSLGRRVELIPPCSALAFLRA